MNAQGAYSLDLNDDEFVVRIPANAIDREGIARFLDYLALESIRRRSQMTAEQAQSLIDEIVDAVWQTLSNHEEQR